MRLQVEQIILKKAFEYWADHCVQRDRVKSLYLYPGAGHTTLWKMLREERHDLVLVAETLALGWHHGFVDKFSVGSRSDSYVYKVESKIVIIDSGGFSVSRYEKFIINVFRCKAKGVLVS